MGLNLSGYVLERPRVGKSNALFTYTPNSGAGFGFNFFFDSSETQPEHGYLLLCLQGGKLPSSVFGWVKNDTLTRFGYNNKKQSFLPLPGEGRRILGTLSATANTNRLKVRTPVSTDVVSYPLRVTLAPNVGVPLTLVPSFGTPAPGTVEVLLSTGELNWASDLLATYDGVIVYGQDQTFPSQGSSLGFMGDSLYLNPIPASGQFPLVRIGWGLPLDPIEVPNESSFPALAAGTFAWAADTGKLAFSLADASAFPDLPIFYDGVLNNNNVTLGLNNLGPLSLDGSTSNFMSPAPLPGDGDVIVSAGGEIFPITKIVNSFSSSIPKGTVEITTTGVAKLSEEDAANHVGQDVFAVPCDVPLEHGVTFRLFRSLADPTLSDPTVFDVTSIVTVEDQKWAEPIQENLPFVFTPTIPLEEAGYPTTVKILQGAGSFTSTDLPRLDRLPLASPFEGYGYVFNETEERLYFARRRRNFIYPALTETTAVYSLGDPTIQSRGLLVEEETAIGSGTYSPLVQGETFVLDPLSGTLAFSSVQGSLVVEGTSGSVSGNTLTDSISGVFSGVLAGDDVFFATGEAFRVVTVVNPNQITLSSTVATPVDPLSYSIRRNPEILVHRTWQKPSLTDPSLVFTRTRPLGTITNSPRLTVDPTELGRFVVVFSGGAVSTAVNQVTSFTNPLLLPSLTVEVNALGELNFSDTDVLSGGVVRVRVTQRPEVDFRVTPSLGFFDVTSRFFSGETAEITYRKASDLSLVVAEPVTFLRRKVPLEHPFPTDSVLIPLEGHTLASNPAPRVWRSGRPQTFGKDYQVFPPETLQFLPSTQVTKAFPAGVPVQPGEQLVCDFWVLEAMGGEKSFTSVNPIYSPPVTLSSGLNTLLLPGDQTSLFPSNSYLRLDQGSELHEVANSVFLPSGQTQVNFYSSFRDSRTSPILEVCYPLRVSSPVLGRTELVLSVPTPTSSPKGSQSLSFVGDVTNLYPTGTVLSYRDGVSIRDSYYVTGSKFDGVLTTVTLGSTLSREVSPTATLWRSNRPVAEFSSSSFRLSTSPITNQPILVSFGEEGVEGSTLIATANSSGEVVLPTPLQPGQEVVASYLGQRFVSQGKTLRVTSVSFVAPDSTSNGIAGQKLRLDFSLFNPDSFYLRVVPLHTYRQEIEQELLDAAKGVTSGPVTENSATPSLATSGVPSLFWEEGHLRNNDLAARSYLFYYHNLIQTLESVMTLSDGLIPGSGDGPFRYNGVEGGSASSVLTASNQIDDLINISFNKQVPAYLAGFQSRFFPSAKGGFGLTLNTSTDKAPIYDTGLTNVLSIGLLTTRMPWARVEQVAEVGSSQINVDSVVSSPSYDRPAFQIGMEIVIQAEDGTYFYPPTSPAVISGFFGSFILLSAPLVVEIPEGATVTRSPSDASLVLPPVVFHQEGRDFTLDGENGLALYKQPQPPYDGSDPLVPVSLRAHPVPANSLITWFGSHRHQEDFPFRFPALDGKAENDDGDISIPLVSPTFACEKNGLDRGYLPKEKEILNDINSLTTPELQIGSVDVDVSGTILTRSFPLSFPVGILPGDLVRFLTGVNATPTYYRILTANLASITLDAPATTDSGVLIAVIHGADFSSTGDVITFGFQFQDASAPFTTLDVGKTIVIETGVDARERRQITGFVSSTLVDIDFPLTVSVGVGYRLATPLATYGGFGSYTQDYDTVAASLVTLYQDFVTAIDQFFSGLFETELSSSSGETLPPDTFQDTLQNFSSLPANCFLYLTSGVDYGIYPVTSVLSSTTLQIGAGTSPFFASSASGLSYQIVTFTTIEASFLYSLFQLRVAAEAAKNDLLSFSVPYSTLVPVVGSPQARAVAILQSELTTRVSQNDARQLVVGDPRSLFTPILSSDPDLYDLRYAWIVARIHRISGYLNQISRAVETRIDATEEQRNRLLLLKGI